MKAVVLIAAMGLWGSVFSQEKEHLGSSEIKPSESNEIEDVLNKRQALEVNIYPNPSKGVISIEAKEGASISIYSASGTYVGTWVVGPENKLVIEDLPQGSFVCSILEGESRSIKKLVIL